MTVPHADDFDVAAPLPPDCFFSPIDFVAAARSDASVLFTGERSRAEALAREIHNASGWRYGRFLVVDCTLPEWVLERDLFGLLSDEPGVSADAPPQLHPAQDGTIFLRDVDGLAATMQIRLAEWLEQFRGTAGRRRRNRLMSSTSTPLLGRISDRTFDNRLYYRLNVIHVVLPPSESR